MIQKMLSNEELLIVLRLKINFGRDQKAAAIDCLATSVLDLEKICIFFLSFADYLCTVSIFEKNYIWYKFCDL
jgi:hypothetical protein